MYTRCGAIGVEAVFSTTRRSRSISSQQTYSISIEVQLGGAWKDVKGSEVRAFGRAVSTSDTSSIDSSMPAGSYKYRVIVQNHTSAPLLGTMWVNVAANDNNPADHDLADCQ